MLLCHSHGSLKAVDVAHHQELRQKAEAVPTPPTAQQQCAEQRRERRLYQYEQIHLLRRQGMMVPDIAHHLGMGERTVFRYLASSQFPGWRLYPHYTCRSALAPYKPCLLERWNAGHRQSKQLFVQIQQQDYRGSYPTLARYTHQLRQAQRQQLNDQDGRGVFPDVVVPPQPPLTARRATWLMLRPQPKRRDRDEAIIARQPAMNPKSLSCPCRSAENMQMTLKKTIMSNNTENAWLNI